MNIYSFIYLAAFLVANPDNTFIKNSVVGCSHYGFWYRLLDQSEGVKSYVSVSCPSITSMGTFDANVVHSVGQYGLWIFPQYMPTDS